jgi:hypothetical protein
VCMTRHRCLGSGAAAHHAHHRILVRHSHPERHPVARHAHRGREISAIREPPRRC